jgi:uncharacterized protein YndB with AHSA1/START domain
MSRRIPVCAIVTRAFAASSERVFDAWLNCDMLERWMFGPAVRDEEIIHLAIDPRVGGSFSFMVQRGDDAIEHVGKYFELSRPRRLVFTWIVTDESVGSRVLVDIVPRGEGCELTLTHELHPDWITQVDLTVAAWNTMLAALAAALGES